MRFGRPLCAALASALLLACSANAQQGCAPAGGTPKLTVQPRPDHALVADATVESTSPIALALEYGNAQAGWLRTPTREAATSHTLPLVRLRPNTTYEVRALATDEAGCTASASSELTTGELPELYRRVAIDGQGRPSAPLTLMDLRLAEGRRALLGLDHDWQPVWYYSVPREVLRPQQGNRSLDAVIRLSSGNLLYVVSDFGFEEVSPDARSVRRLQLEELRTHHDMLELPDGRILTIGAEARPIDDRRNGGPPDLLTQGDTLNLIDLAGGSVQKVWSVFDTHAPADRPSEWRGVKTEGAEDWTHANSVSLGPNGSVLVSFRNLSQVISLSADFRTVEWRLGGADSSFSFPEPADQFYGQHTATQLPNGNLLVFDNGNFRPEGDYSRALELALDFQTMTARKVWEYRHRPDLYSEKISSAQRLANGNTLVNFGFLQDPADPIFLVEAQPDGTAASTLQIRIPGTRATRYRAYPLETLGGERAVDPPALAKPAGHR